MPKQTQQTQQRKRRLFDQKPQTPHVPFVHTQAPVKTAKPLYVVQRHRNFFDLDKP